jgi:hypothetical protein
MIKYGNKRKIAVLDKDDNPVVRHEEILRVTNVYVDYVAREVKAIFRRGYTNDDGSFTVSSWDPIIVDFTGALFTLLITPAKDHKNRWAGDFRLSDIEQLARDHGMLPDFEINAIQAQ